MEGAILLFFWFIIEFYNVNVFWEGNIEMAENDEKRETVEAELVEDKREENSSSKMSYNYSTDYFGLEKIVSIIIAIFIGSIIGGIIRIIEGKILAGVLRIVLYALGVGIIINILDVIMIATTGKMLRVIEQ